MPDIHLPFDPLARHILEGEHQLAGAQESDAHVPRNDPWLCGISTASWPPTATVTFALIPAGYRPVEVHPLGSAA